MRYLIERVGVRRALKVIAFIVAWEVARNDLGRDISIEEYGEWWKVSRASAFREQALFRQVLGDRYATPAGLVAEADAQRIAVQQVRLVVS
jgi:hypothetical protein